MCYRKLKKFNEAFESLQKVKKNNFEHTANMLGPYATPINIEANLEQFAYHNYAEMLEILCKLGQNPEISGEDLITVSKLFGLGDNGPFVGLERANHALYVAVQEYDAEEETTKILDILDVILGHMSSRKLINARNIQNVLNALCFRNSALIRNFFKFKPKKTNMLSG